METCRMCRLIQRDHYRIIETVVEKTGTLKLSLQGDECCMIEDELVPPLDGTLFQSCDVS